MADTHNDYGVRQNGGTNSTYLDKDMESDAALKRIQTAGSISISPELFEKLYLSPQTAVKGDLRKTFANPTPACMIGFLMALTPTCINLLGWRGSGGSGAAYIGAYYWFGGAVMLIGSILEFILGNTLTYVVFTTFGAHWLTSASTLTPSFNVYALYSPNPAVPIEGLASPEFLASYAFYLLFMGVLCFIFLICSLRTNAAFVLIFICLSAAFPITAAEYWALSVGNAATAATLQTASGSILFVVAMIGWYILIVQLLAAVDMPFTLPLFDLSHLIISGTERAKRRQNAGYSA